jgi:hypothetical protein
MKKDQKKSRECRKCFKTLPCSEEYFWKKGKGPNGRMRYDSVCIPCARDRKRTRYRDSTVVRKSYSVNFEGRTYRAARTGDPYRDLASAVVIQAYRDLETWDQDYNTARGYRIEEGVVKGHKDHNSLRQIALKHGIPERSVKHDLYGAVAHPKRFLDGLSETVYFEYLDVDMEDLEKGIENIKSGVFQFKHVNKKDGEI